MKIIIGLGNPGKKYEQTKHNVGFMAVDYLVNKLGGEWQSNKKFNALICKVRNDIFVKPLTFMNDSGSSVSKVVSFFKLLPKTLGIFKNKNANLSENLIVIHDDIDIPLGEYKTSIDSRSAGHKGVQSIIDYLKTKNFKRIRIGILDEKKLQVETKKLVLEKLKKEEKEEIDNLIERIEI